MMQPAAISGAVAKPNSSAPSIAPITTSRPVRSPPSTCTAMRPRNPLRTNVCWVSASPISQGEPAWVSEVSGLAPVPPSNPAIVTWSERALLTPAATVPTPTSETSFTEMRARGLAFFRSWISCAILDRVDVVMRRRRDEADPGGRIAHPGDDLVDLAAGQLAALAWLGALRHLDLQDVGIDQVFGGDAEPARGDLLDRRAHRVAVRQRLEARRFL